jgi:glycosyltransferase involved in cell wall biosynthesis
VVIPCLNQGSNIASLVLEVRKRLPVVVVVDDGSVDGTGTAALGAGAIVVGHGVNMGKGAALRTGLSAAIRQGLAWAVTMDGDGQHKPEDIPRFFACAERTGAALVVGDRMQDARAIPWLRRQVNRWMSRQLSRRAGRLLPDTQCGFRLVDLKVWATLALTTQHFEVESETLLAFLAAGRRVEFAPVQVVGQGPRSHIHPVTDSWRWWRWWRSLSQPKGPGPHQKPRSRRFGQPFTSA